MAVNLIHTYMYDDKQKNCINPLVVSHLVVTQKQHELNNCTLLLCGAYKEVVACQHLKTLKL